MPKYTKTARIVFNSQSNKLGLVGRNSKLLKTRKGNDFLVDVEATVVASDSPAFAHLELAGTVPEWSWHRYGESDSLYRTLSADELGYWKTVIKLFSQRQIEAESASEPTAEVAADRDYVAEHNASVDELRAQRKTERQAESTAKAKMAVEKHPVPELQDDIGDLAYD